MWVPGKGGAGAVTIFSDASLVDITSPSSSRNYHRFPQASQMRTASKPISTHTNFVLAMARRP